MAQQPVVQRVFGAYDAVTKGLVGLTTSGEAPYSPILGSAQIVASLAALRLVAKQANVAVFVLGASTPGDGGGGTFAYVPTDTTTGATYTGAIAGTVLTVSSVQSGTLSVGQFVNNASTGLSLGTITSFGSGVGGPGTYNLSFSTTIIGPQTFTGDDNNSPIVGSDGGRWYTVVGSLYPTRTAAEIAAGVFPINYNIAPGYINRYGFNAVPGTTDMGAIINTALSCNTVVYLNAETYFTSVTITVLPTCMLQGTGFCDPTNNGVSANNPTGTIIIGALTLTPIVQQGNFAQHSSSVRGLNIIRAAGTPGAATQGLQVAGGQCQSIQDVFVSGHGFPLYVTGNKGGGVAQGGQLFLNRVFTGAAQTAHLVVDTFPEVRGTLVKLGTNGLGDGNCTSYIRITGGNASQPAAGPNTVVFTNCQMNQGQVGPLHCWDFVNLTAPGLPSIDARVFSMVGCHVEAMQAGGGVLHSDATWNSLDRVVIEACDFNVPTSDFFQLNAATTVNAMRIANNHIAAATFSPTSTNINELSVVGNAMENLVATYNPPGSWTVSSVGNVFGAGATCVVSGSNWNQALFADTYRPGSTFTNTGTPSNAITVINPLQSTITYTPTLAFGGASTGIVYTIQTAALQIEGNKVTILFRIQISNKGSASGVATLGNCPIPQGSGLYQTGGGGVLTQNSGMVGLNPAPVIANGIVGTAPGQINLIQQTATGTTQLTDANFSNSSQFSGHITFFA